MNGDIEALAAAVGVLRIRPAAAPARTTARRAHSCSQCGNPAVRAIVWYSGRRGWLCDYCMSPAALASLRGAKRRG